jgi:GDP-L-fucose synthase
MKIKGSILLLGASGLVGSAVYRKLLEYGVPASKIDAPTSKQLNLLTMEGASDYNKVYDYVINCAGRVGGILANSNEKYSFIHDNILMQMNVMKLVEHSADWDRMKKYVFLGSSCVYPNDHNDPIKETSLMTGPLEPTNEAYSVAKIAGIKLGQAFFQNATHKFSAIMPCNVYGPHDRYDAGSHVIADMIQKFSRSDVDTVPLYGDGEPLREFIYSDDLAEAIIMIATYDGSQDVSMINVGSDFEISIRDLAFKIRELTSPSSRIVFDAAFPNGTMRKKLDTTKMEEIFGWKAKTNLDEGLTKSIDWYRWSQFSEDILK